MGFKQALANMQDGFRDMLEGEDVQLLLEEFRNTVPEDTDPLILQIFGTIVGHLAAKGVDPVKLGSLCVVMAKMSADAVDGTD